MAIKRNRRKLYEYIVEEIGLRILKGAYQVGDTLPNEDTLSKELDISRGVLREATKVLTQKGLIQTRPKTGTQVMPRSNWNLFDRDVLTWKLQLEDQYTFLKKVTEVRCIIESEAARFAAQRACDDDIDRMRKQLAEMQNLFEGTSEFNYQEYLDKDMAFHTAVMEASSNELLSQIAFTMRQAVYAARQMDIQDTQVHLESMQLHQAVLNAIEKRDAQAAYVASQKMFDQVWQNIPSCASTKL
jgi:DNA-binding FadR family transcriptional regulator